MSDPTANIGKITAANFKNLLFNSLGSRREEILTGPRYGVDTAVIDLGNGLGMAVSSDPLSLIPSLGLKESAWLSVHLLANDMATTGFSPQFAQFVLNLPVYLSEGDFKIYWDYIHRFCKELGIAITGGHTGRVPGQESTISGGGTMFLTAPTKEILTSDKARPGNAIIVTKESALSSTAILAKSFPETVKNKLANAIYEQAADNFYQTSSLREAVLAAELLKPHQSLKALHDVTEGGIMGAICEMAEASSCGFLVYDDKIPVGEAQQQIAALFEIDHRYSIGAGSMIMAVSPDAADKLIAHLAENKIKATVVGHFTEHKEGFLVQEKDRMITINYEGIDPYWEAFFKAYKNGLQ